MKRLLALVLVILFVFSAAPSLADGDHYLYAHFALFIDGNFYNSFFNAGFDYDTLMYDFYLYDDFSGGLFMKEEWFMGDRINYGLKEVRYEKDGDGAFKLVFEDNSFIRGYWDPEIDDDIWLNFGGDMYFRLTAVPSFDIQKDLVEK